MPTHPKLLERARRISRIRRTVMAATLAAFVLFWGVIVFEGSMGATTLASTSGTTTTTTQSSGPTSSSNDSTSSSSSSDDSSSSTGDSPAPVTTGQS